MALVVADRVKETTTTTGTGAVSLAGATTGFQSFSAGVGDGNTTYYAINLVGGSEWEVGIGEYTQSTDTLSRDTVLASSNSGSLVNFSAGTKDVFVTYPADKAVYEDANGVAAAGAVDVSTETRYAGDTTTLSTTSKTQIASFSSTTFTGAKLIVMVTEGTERQISELLIAHDGSSASATEYGVVYTGSAPLADFDVDLLSGNVRLLATGASSSSTEYNVTEILMVA